MAFTYALKFMFVALMLYALIYALLKKVKIIEDERLNSLLSLLSVIIVSFTGIITYVVMYAVNLFVIIIFLLFLILVILAFMGLNLNEFLPKDSKFWKIFAGILVVIFLVVFIKGYFAVNNEYSGNHYNANTDNISHNVNTSANIGFKTGNIFSHINFNNGLVTSALFIIVLGLAVMFI